MLKLKSKTNKRMSLEWKIFIGTKYYPFPAAVIAKGGMALMTIEFISSCRKSIFCVALHFLLALHLYSFISIHYCENKNWIKDPFFMSLFVNRCPLTFHKPQNNIWCEIFFFCVCVWELHNCNEFSIASMLWNLFIWLKYQMGKQKFRYSKSQKENVAVVYRVYN